MARAMGLRASLVTLTAEMDATVRQINAAAPSGQIPMLSGLDATQLRDGMRGYSERLKASSERMGDDQIAVKLNLMVAARLVMPLARELIQLAEAEALVLHIEDSIAAHSAARSRWETAVVAADAVLADVDADVAFLDHADSPEARRALIDRKIKLLSEHILPGLREAVKIWREAVIPSRERVAIFLRSAMGFTRQKAALLAELKGMARERGRDLNWTALAHVADVFGSGNDLRKDFTISAQGEKKGYERTRMGRRIESASLLPASPKKKNAPIEPPNP